MKELLTKIALKQLPCILQIGFGIGAGAVQPLKGFIQNGNNSAVFFQRGRGTGISDSLP